MSAVRIVISGRVQGIGYRDWLVHRAHRAGVRGWVRNLGETQVEAVLVGQADAVERLVSTCWEGPRGARVTAVTRAVADDPGVTGFCRRPSARQ